MNVSRKYSTWMWNKIERNWCLQRVLKALLAREAALISLESVRRQQDDINKAYGLLSEKEHGAGLTRSEVARVNKARGDRDVVQQTVKAAEEQYAVLKNRNLRDVADFQRDHDRDMCEMVRARLDTSVAVLADILLISPRRLFIFII